MNNELGNVVSQEANKFSENDGRNAKVDGVLQSLMGQKYENATGMGKRKERKRARKEGSK